MRVLRARYNRFRRPEYQIQTTIFENKGKKFVAKKALTYRAIAHLQKEEQNYYQLARVASGFCFPALVEKRENELIFQFIEGRLVKDILIDCILAGDVKSFVEIIGDYYSMLQHGFEQADALYIAPQEKYIVENLSQAEMTMLADEQVFFKKTYLDPIFSNIISTDTGKYLIDYEWILDSSLPLTFLFTRSLFFTFIHRYSYIRPDHFVGLDALYEKFSLSEQQIKLYKKIELNIQRKIHPRIEGLAGYGHPHLGRQFLVEAQKDHEKARRYKKELDRASHRFASFCNRGAEKMGLAALYRWIKNDIRG